MAYFILAKERMRNSSKGFLRGEVNHISVKKPDRLTHRIEGLESVLERMNAGGSECIGSIDNSGIGVDKENKKILSCDVPKPVVHTDAVLGRRVLGEKPYHHLVDCAGNFIITIFDPECRPDLTGPYFLCADGRYAKSMSVEVMETRNNKFMLRSRVYLTPEGYCHALPFFDKHDIVDIGAKDRSRKFDGQVEDSFFSVLYHHNSSKDYAVFIRDIIPDKMFKVPPVLVREQLGKGKVRYRIEQTSDNINSVIYQALERTFSNFEPALR